MQDRLHRSLGHEVGNQGIESRELALGRHQHDDAGAIAVHEAQTLVRLEHVAQPCHLIARDEQMALHETRTTGTRGDHGERCAYSTN
jgi:hypothetical protein